MNRRGFFRSLLGVALAPLAARWLPAVSTTFPLAQGVAPSVSLDALYATTWRLSRDAIVSNLEQASPLYTYLRERRR